MERIYRGLMWVAGGALVCGVILIWWTNWLQHAGEQGGYFIYSALGGGFNDNWAGYVVLIAEPLLEPTLEAFLIGAALVAIVVAWAERRYRWLVALVATCALAVVAPIALAVNNPLLITHPRVAELVNTDGPQLANLLRILPCVMAIAMTSISAKWILPRREARTRADAEMEITRSSL
jgi:hypothetical protein